MSKNIKKIVMKTLDEADFNIFKEDKFVVLIGAKTKKEIDKIAEKKNALFVRIG